MHNVPIDICWVWNYVSMENKSKRPGNKKWKTVNLKTSINHIEREDISAMYRQNKYSWPLNTAGLNCMGPLPQGFFLQYSTVNIFSLMFFLIKFYFLA